MDVSDIKKLKALEEENKRLKELVADLTLDNKILKDINHIFIDPGRKSIQCIKSSSCYPNVLEENVLINASGTGPS